MNKRILCALAAASAAVCASGLSIDESFDIEVSSNASLDEINPKRILLNHKPIVELFGDRSNPPNIIDVLGALPRPIPGFGKSQPLMLRQTAMQKGRKNTPRVAVCVTGHLRTFLLKGVHQSLRRNLFDSYPGEINLFFVGHEGDYAGNIRSTEALSSWHKHFASLKGQDLQDAEAKLKKTLADERYYMKGVHIFKKGDCGDLRKAWNGRGRYASSNYCPLDHPVAMQAHWLDYCVRMVKSQPRPYDLLIRTRPDVAMIEPMPWESTPVHTLGYLPKSGDGYQNDWFFSIPMSQIDSYWKAVMELYDFKTELPDVSSFELDGRKFTYGTEETNFPVVIVRGPREADCFRLGLNTLMMEQCKRMTETGLFEHGLM